MTKSSGPTLLFAAADPGGANAVLPVALALAARGAPVALVDHGFLGRNAPAALRRLPPPVGGTLNLAHTAPAAIEAAAKLAEASARRGTNIKRDHRASYLTLDGLGDWLAAAGIGALCFGTSLADHLPLSLARAARARGVPVVCVLDNWMNYRARLEMDGGPLLLPDLYAVMDDKALAEALAEGVPDSCLRVTGHPGLAGLAQDIEVARPDEVRARLGLGGAGRQMIAFIGEPVAHDQGTGPEMPGWRGYSERDVLPLLCRELQSQAGRLDVAIVPHPRDDVAALEDLWQTCRGELGGGLVREVAGRQVVLAADRVAGMASILLYEAWLRGKPVLSLQPGLVRDDMARAVERPGIVMVTRREQAAAAIAGWLVAGQGEMRPDCRRHGEAPARLADLMQHLVGRVHGEA